MLMRIVLMAALLPCAAFGQERVCTPLSASTMVRYDHALNGAFEAEGKQFRIDPDLGRAVTAAESGFNPQAVSAKGAQGLMQLMPGTAQTVHVADPFDPKQSIRGGMAFLRMIANMPAYSGKPYMILLAYNAGPNRKTFPPESYRYADRVLEIYWKLKSQRMAANQKIAPSRGLDFLSLPRCGATQSKPPVQRVVFVHGQILPSHPYRHYP
jgi:soluble lytic murein transglycosylase-like protein